jgi:hypothetical protein
MVPRVYGSVTTGAVDLPATTGLVVPDDRLGALFDLHHERLYRLARRLSATVEDARDLVQDTYVRAARSIDAVPCGQAAVWGRALNDIKDVLPYTAYRLVDNQWILSSGRGRVAVRLKGTDAEEYALTMHTVLPYHSVPAGGGQVPAVAAEPRILVDRFLLTGASGVSVDDAERDLAEAMGRYSKGLLTQEEVDRRMQQLDAATRATKEGAPGRTLIDTSFVMDVGETVVVGTSRVQGDRAIIVLLTAAAK